MGKNKDTPIETELDPVTNFDLASNDTIKPIELRADDGYGLLIETKKEATEENTIEMPN